MDQIYEHADLTIINVHGEDDRAGLPGVSQTPRSEQLLLLLVKTCQKIERLEFVQTTLGTKSILESVNLARSLKSLNVHEDIEIHGDTITRMLQLRPTLEELRIHQVGGGCSTTRQLDVTCENLRVLDLRDVDYRFEDQHHLVST